MRPIIIGVAGGSGSGKTTVVREMLRELGPHRASVIQHDSYYYDRSHIPPAERLTVNYDHPDALDTSLLIEHLVQLRGGRPVQVPVYDFTNHERAAETVTVEPRPLVVLEGILVLAHDELRDMMDIRVFVDTDHDLRFIRRLKRDINERGRTAESVVVQYLDTVRPMHLQFVEPSKQHAHIIVPGEGSNQRALTMLMNKVSACLSEKGDKETGDEA